MHSLRTQLSRDGHLKLLSVGYAGASDDGEACRMHGLQNARTSAARSKLRQHGHR